LPASFPYKVVEPFKFVEKQQKRYLKFWCHVAQSQQTNCPPLGEMHERLLLLERDVGNNILMAQKFLLNTK
jgi:hypothetical protein